MSTDSTEPNSKTRIVALAAMAVALVAGLGLFRLTNRDAVSPNAGTKPAAVIATSCNGFEADAPKLLKQAGTAVLSGTFAPGDHVRLVIEINGGGYSWDSTGVLGAEPKLARSYWFSWYEYDMHNTITFTPAAGSTPASSSTVSRGKVSGLARMELDIDVTTAGDGAITFGKTGSAPWWSLPARVVSASCSASGTKSLRPMV